MRKAFPLIIILLLSNSVLTYASEMSVIYGEDNRSELLESTNNLYKIYAKSTAAMIPSYRIPSSALKNEFITLYSQSLKRKLIQQNICPMQRFADQMALSRCTGFLVAPDVLVTAAHCIKNEFDCRSNSWIFDYNMNNTRNSSVDLHSLKIPSNSVYRCEKILAIGLTSKPRGGKDYAVIKLNRKVTDRFPLDYRISGKVADDAQLVTIGNPLGLPTKITDGGEIRDNTEENYFVTTLDTFSGNSGGPVIDMNTGVVEGILIRGEDDFLKSDNPDECRKVKICDEDECRGEDVMRITHISLSSVISK